MAQAVSKRRRHFSYMKECCVDFSCEGDFVSLADRLVKKSFEPMFDYIHEDLAGGLSHTVPNTKKWLEFLFDYNDYDTVVKFENDWTTKIDVNVLGRNKVFCAWRISDRYQGRFDGKGLTRNLVDVKFAISFSQYLVFWAFLLPLLQQTKRHTRWLDCLSTSQRHGSNIQQVFSCWVILLMLHPGGTHYVNLVNVVTMLKTKPYHWMSSWRCRFGSMRTHTPWTQVLYGWVELFICLE